MEKMWNHVLFNELRVAPAEVPVLMTEATMNPKINREKMTQVMFETFNVPCLYTNIQAVFAIYDFGRTTGVVVDSGYDVSHTIPIYEGVAIPDYTQKMSLAGKDLTEYLRQLLKEKGFSCSTPDDLAIVNHIKESKTFVAANFNMAMQEAKESSNCGTTYELADGTKI